MSLINLSVKHGRTLEEARERLATAVNQVQSQFGALVQRVEWAADRNRVQLFGSGFQADLRVDAQDVHATVDIPLLGGFLQNTLTSGLKGILRQTFQKQLPKP
jgi:hypothetical protein